MARKGCETVVFSLVILPQKAAPQINRNYFSFYLQNKQLNSVLSRNNFSGPVTSAQFPEFKACFQPVIFLSAPPILLAQKMLCQDRLREK
jgi:hypothetical protein